MWGIHRVRLHLALTFNVDAHVLDCPFLQPIGLVDNKSLNRSICRVRLFSSRFSGVPDHLGQTNYAEVCILVTKYISKLNKIQNTSYMRCI